MEKVKLTQEQANEIKKIKDIDYAINIHGLNKRPDSPLASLKTSDIARSFYVGYEVKPEFKVRDWVVHENGVVSRITKITDSGVIFTDYPLSEDETRYMNTIEKYFRHATPEEIAEEKQHRWWAKHERDVWGLRVNDVLSFAGHTHTVEKITGTRVQFSETHRTEGVDFIKRNYRVVCFAEDRQDA